MDAEAGNEPCIRVLIADDEPLARDLIRRLLVEAGGFAVVGETQDGRETLAALRIQPPEVAFLDVRMPYLDGINAARHANSERTLFVFVTSYERHAIDAFEAGGLDYLLKPIDRERFMCMVGKLRREVRRRRIEALFDAGVVQSARDEDRETIPNLQFKVGAEILFVAQDEIVRLEAANQYVCIHLVSGRPILAAGSLSAFQGKLEASRFLRVHRSAIINRDHVEAIRTDSARRIYLVLTGDVRVPVSRRFRALLSRVAPLRRGRG